MKKICSDNYLRWDAIVIDPDNNNQVFNRICIISLYDLSYLRQVVLMKAKRVPSPRV